jgi:hypothetical protein
MISDRSLSNSAVTAIMHVPLEKVNIADWLFTLPDAEYQRCSHANIAAGTTPTDDGRPMSINVETIGDALIVQHYVAEVKKPALCRMVSISDSITKNGRTKMKVEWTLSARRLDDETTEYTNHIMPRPRTNSLFSSRSMESHLNRLHRPARSLPMHTTGKKRPTSLPASNAMRLSEARRALIEYFGLFSDGVSSLEWSLEPPSASSGGQGHSL